MQELKTEKSWELYEDVTMAMSSLAPNTTLGIIVTNAKFHKTQLTKIAGMTHNGYARAIRPVHTNADGDSIYALSVGELPGDVNVVGAMAARAMEKAIVRAVRAARSAYGLPGYGGL